MPKSRSWFYKNAFKKLITKPIRNRKSSKKAYIENVIIEKNINKNNLT